MLVGVGNVSKIQILCNCYSGPKRTKYKIRHQHWHNVHTTLPECFLNCGPHYWGATLPQHSHSIAWMSLQHQFQMLGYIATPFIQCCLNIVPMPGKEMFPSTLTATSISPEEFECRWQSSGVESKCAHKITSSLEMNYMVLWMCDNWCSEVYECVISGAAWFMNV